MAMAMATATALSSPCCAAIFHLRYNYRQKPPPPLSTTISTAAGRFQLGRRRGMSVVTRAGLSTTSYIFAFVFPLSLLGITILTSIRVADKLDQKYLEDLAINQAILEAEEEEDDDYIEVGPSEVEDSTTSRSRNRPKREVEPSSK